MIGSWFELQTGWGWEVVGADGTVLANGTAAHEDAAGWDCRVALHVARTESGLEPDVALAPAGTRFGGRWAALTAA